MGKLVWQERRNREGSDGRLVCQEEADGEIRLPAAVSRRRTRGRWRGHVTHIATRIAEQAAES